MGWHGLSEAEWKLALEQNANQMPQDPNA